MAEFKRLPTQQELEQILYMQGLRPQPTSDIVQSNLASQTISPIPENIFQKMAGGAGIAKEQVNKLGSASDLAKLFPGYTGQSKVNIPTGYNFAMKQNPMGGVIPAGIQTQQVNVDQLLKAIKPADVLGLTGAQQAYSDVGISRAPNPMDVLDVAGLGAAGLGAGKGLLAATKGIPVGMSIQDVSKAGLLAQAPKSDIGFYSAVEQAAMASPRKSATGQAFLNDIMKGPDVRADEIKWIGLDDYLKGKQNVTKQEVQDYIANNRVNVEEVKSTIPRLPGEEMAGDKGSFLPKFAQYQLPGGENYRELLLTMPTKKPLELNEMSVGELQTLIARNDKNADTENLSKPELLQMIRNMDLSSVDISNLTGKNTAEYVSSHFPQANILAHLRVNDRVDADGKKMLLIEEVQSDWHQTGRDQGYKTKENLENWYNQNKLNEDPPFSELNSEQRSIIEQNRNAGMGGDVGVPDAPFKDTWYQLALKRAIQHAAENGYDRIGLTTGSRQAERFDLSKQLSGVSYNTEFKRIAGFDKSGNPVVYQADVEPDQIANYIGKEAAKKLLEQPLQNKEYELRGVDLQVGGEGMKKYYDEIYPKFLDKYGKKWGAKVGETRVNPIEKISGGNIPMSYVDEPVRYIDITPEMKAGVSKGQPLFTAAPIVGGGGLLGAQQEDRK